MNERKRTLELSGAPCVYYSKDEKTGKMEKYFPSVDCGLKCENCGWNPYENERRWREGSMVETIARKNAETGELVELPAGTRRLVFPKKEVSGV